MNPIENLPNMPSQEESILNVEEVYESAIAEHREFKNVPAEEIKGLIREVILEIEQLEEIAERDFRNLNLEDEVARRVEAVWVLSGPGTYDEPVKEDRYKNYPWARGMDRARLNYAARIARRVAEVRSGRSFERGGLGSIKQRKESIKRSISERGPYIIYNGRPDENAVVRDILGREGVIMPQEKVIIIEKGIDKSVDQAKTIRLPKDFDIERDELGVISHAPQLARVMRMINRYKPFPEGTKIRLLPLPTPQEGRVEYATMEIRGILYYAYLSPNREAAKESYAYLLNQPTRRVEEDHSV